LSFFLPITRSSDSSFGSAHWSRPTGLQCRRASIRFQRAPRRPVVAWQRCRGPSASSGKPDGHLRRFPPTGTSQKSEPRSTMWTFLRSSAKARCDSPSRGRTVWLVLPGHDVVIVRVCQVAQTGRPGDQFLEPAAARSWITRSGSVVDRAKCPARRAWRSASGRLSGGAPAAARKMSAIPYRADPHSDTGGRPECDRLPLVTAPGSGRTGTDPERMEWPVGPQPGRRSSSAGRSLRSPR
jgi:hypothetical protein